MVEFNEAIYNSWILLGFKFVQCKCFGADAVLSPLFEDNENTDIGYTMDIHSVDVVKMATSKGNLIFYVLP
jgi:hypothetical protein